MELFNPRLTFAIILFVLLMLFVIVFPMLLVTSVKELATELTVLLSAGSALGRDIFGMGTDPFVKKAVIPYII